MRGGRSEENPFQRWKHLHWFSEAATALERTEQVANPKGVSKGIDTAEAKQAQHKTKKSKKLKKDSKSKGKAGSK